MTNSITSLAPAVKQVNPFIDHGWSEQWPGTQPPDCPQILVTYIGFIGTCWPCRHLYGAYYGVYQGQLVTPSGNPQEWYVDFKQPHRLLTSFCTWEPGQPQETMAERYATPDAPAFWFDQEEAE